MNKQEVIDKQALIDELMKIPGVGSNSDVLKTIKRFPSYEPQKVKVPAFVAPFIEKLKITNSRYGVELEKAYNNEEDEELVNWLWFNENVLTLFRALEKGYEVEEEPKWKIINDQKYCLTSIEAGYGNSLHWAFDSTKKKPILFDNEETALYTAYITGGKVEKV